MCVRQADDPSFLQYCVFVTVGAGRTAAGKTDDLIWC